MQFSFLHTADLHLDTPFSGLEQADPSVAESLRDASIDALKRIATEAVSRKVDFVLFAGDIYDGSIRGLRAQLAFKSALVQLNEHGIKAFVIHGNHDPLDGWSAIHTFPENTHIFSSDYEAIPFLKDGRVVATIHGASYGQNHVEENLANTYEQSSEGFQIALLHTEIDNANSPYAPCSLDQLVRSGFDYWALGHIHDRQVLSERPHVVYPGNPQGRSFSEEGPKGVYHVCVADGAIERFEFVETGTWRFRTATVDTSDVDDISELSGRIQDELHDERSDRMEVVRVKLTGRSDVHGLLAREGTSALVRELRAELGCVHPRTWLARVEDDTCPAFDIPTIVRRDDFHSEVVRMADTWEQVPDPLNAVLTKHRGLLRLLLGNALDDTESDILAARDLALEYLLGDSQ